MATVRRSPRPAPLALLVLLTACAAGEGDAARGAGTPLAGEATPETRPPEIERPVTTEPPAEDASETTDDMAENAAAPAEELATFGAGCFWCVEAVLEQLDGVLDVTSGYMGGHVENPSYKLVCTGATGHAEVVQVRFDPARVSYEDLLDWFWRLHDPTTPNRQGNDVGTQYRSAIFVHSDAQRAAAEASKKAAQADFADPIVTEITDAGPYWVATGDHQDYYVQNKNAGYCRMVIRPKLQKLDLRD